MESTSNITTETSKPETTATPKISVVLPIYNEEGNLEPLILEIAKVLEPLQTPFEILCVDDGSQDNSVSKLKELAKADPRVIVICHLRNFGQSAAQATGFYYAKGKIIMTLDSDGQNNPADLPNMLELLEKENYDCVCGARVKRQDNWIRRLSSRIANRVRNWLTGDKIQDSGCNLRVIRKSALLEIPMFNGTHRFLPTLLRYKGKRVFEISVNHRPRTWGKTKYGIGNRAWRGLMDCLAMRWWKKRCFPVDRC